jgi:type II secretory pathway pseudopilin PulG
MNLRPWRSARRSAFTLVEMMVTLTVTLIVMLALVTIFEWIGQRVQMGRAVIEISGQLRSASLRLQSDLDNVTVPMRPFARIEQGAGYFHYREGTGWDGTGTVEGDVDDVLCFTARNDVEHFAGVYTTPSNGTVRVTSPEAEIVWWAQYQDLNQDGTLTPEETASRVLHRRVLVIKPSLNDSIGGPWWFQLPAAYNAGVPSYNITNQSNLQQMAQDLRRLYNEVDVSVRLVRVMTGNNQMQIHVYANSLADLTQPENRFLRHPMVLQSGGSYSLASSPSLPFAVDTNPLSATRLELIPLSGTRLGEDVILSSVLAFDVRAFDPTALVASATGLGVVPSDNAWTPTLAVAAPVNRGAFVDLFYARRHGSNWNAAAASTFSDIPQLKSGIPAANEQPFYDTWSFHFENNGPGTNGLDDDGVNGTDDPGERMTSPPYPVALRGLQSILRVYEADTRQVRQATVVSDFVPE